MAELSFKNLVKAYGKTQVVHKVNLEVRDKEFLVLVGPSGCGKSTILRMIAGLEEISAGSIFIGDRKVNDLAPKDRKVAMVFQNYALYPHMNVFANMSFGLKLKKTPKEEINTRVGEVAAILGLTDLLERKPHELSGGQRQRVAMGRAMVRKPAIFLFDEPLSNLDAKLRIQMRAEIKMLHQRVNSTIVYVTHDQVEAMTLADRIVVLKDGYIEQVGSPLELYQKPANTFVAGFIGTPPMNLMECRIKKTEAGLGLKFNDKLTIPIPETNGTRVEDGRNAVMGLRTEHITLADESQNIPKEWVFDALVDVVEPLGSETHIHASIQGVPMVAKCDGSRIVKSGDHLNLALNLDKIHIFDAETTKALL